jgi:hypothetical protein
MESATALPVRLTSIATGSIQARMVLVVTGIVFLLNRD